MNRLAKPVAWIVALALTGIAGCNESLSPGDRVVASVSSLKFAP